MLNVMLVLSLLYSFGIGFFLVARAEIFNRKNFRYIHRPNPASLSWDHLELYALYGAEEVYEEISA